MPAVPPLATPAELCLPAGVSPFETKLLLTPEQADATTAWAGARLPRDPYVNGADGTYQVASLYFDSPLLEIYHHAHADGISKYRIRRYGAEERIFLECKSKLSGRVVKRRTPVPATELPELQRIDPSSGWAAAWFVEAMAQRALQPVCHVSYVRQAWNGELDGERVRMTLDRELWGSAVSAIELPGPHPDGRPLFSGCVLEIKHTGSLPAACGQWLRELGCEAQRLSKYRQAVQVCGIVTA